MLTKNFNRVNLIENLNNLDQTMDICCPKIVIINHFDSLMNRVDIEIENCLGKCKENQLLSRNKRNFSYPFLISLHSFNSSENENKIYDADDLWSESTKVVDYLKQIRMRTIEKLKKAQEDTLEYYKLSNLKKQLKDEINIDELKSQLFGEKFYFQVLYKPSDEEISIFNLFTICVDFYVSRRYRFIRVITITLFKKFLKLILKSLHFLKENYK